jgi:peptidoglycan/LPS O-acetylase OafA/YrhL
MDSIDLLSTPGIVTLGPAAYFAVDTFFWIGGFLITIGMLEQMMKKRVGFLKFYIGCVVHRFIRIWPTYMVAILMFWKVAPYFGSGPIWNVFHNFACECDNGGIVWNMFFVDNFADHGPSGMKYCFGWGWYLAVDFQLFMITPFIFFTYKKSKKLGWLLTSLLLLASIITAFTMIMVNEWRYPIPNSKLKPQPEFMDKFYYKPYVRASAYFIGIFSGFIYYEWKNKNMKYVKVINYIKNSIPIRIAFYIIGFGMTQFIVWIIVPYQTGGEWSQLAQGFYNSLNR